MAIIQKFLQYRGEPKAILGQGSKLLFVTVHPQGQGTALYRLELDKAELEQEPLPSGGAALVADAEAVYVAGTDGQIYRAPLAKGAAQKLGASVSPPPTALALLAEDRLAALAGKELHVLSRQSGKLLQSLALPEDGTALATDATGRWLVVGTALGSLVIFDGEQKKELLLSETGKLHEGAVRALLFEPGELRVLSAGADAKLLLTHVRGKLEPEDRGGKNNHEKPIRALLSGPGNLFYTAAEDAAIKTWAWDSKARPTTTESSMPQALAIAELKGRPHLMLAGVDQTIRAWQLDAAGKLVQCAQQFLGAKAWAENEFAQPEAKRREAAIRVIAPFKDELAAELLLSRAVSDSDHGLQVLACELLAGVGSPSVALKLNTLLRSGAPEVRKAAFHGLRSVEGQSSLQPIERALKTKIGDVGVLAVEALTRLAATDELAQNLLIEALQEAHADVRAAALRGIESLYPQDSPEGNLLALRSNADDTRSAALLRLYQRQLLDRPEALLALRRHLEDKSPEVRLRAFLISLTTRPRLAQALREKDPALQRLLAELEGKAAEAAPAKPAKAKKGAAKAPEAALAAEDLEPLLQAMACRALDTCLRGATSLALLQDARAFGTLLQLSREKDAPTRVETCKALQQLGDPRGLQRLRLMIRDEAAEVRDAAFSALAGLEEGSPLRAAEAGLAAEHEDVRRRGLQLLIQTIKKGLAGDGLEAGTRLLERALNDPFASVRGEAFKAGLSLKLQGSVPDTLAFLARSLHPDVRKDVLTEIMAQIQQAWAWKLLLGMLGDPDAALRSEAFEFAVKKSSGRALEPLAAALAGKFSDLRIKAVEALIKKKEAGARDLLIRALDDEDKKVRQLALDALLVAEEPEALARAMNARHPDVCVRAAVARASAGDSSALEPLLRLATEKEPGPEATAGARAEWLDRAILALHGLGELGATEARAKVADLLHSQEPRLRQAAAAALAWVSRPGSTEELKSALQHSDEAVRLEAAFGLAVCGDASGAGLLLTASAKPQPQPKSKAQASARPPETNPGQSPASPERALLVAFALEAQAQDRFLAFLDHPNGSLRGRTMTLLLLLEMARGEGSPDRLLAALSSANSRVRLDAARALENLLDPSAFEAYLLETFNDRGQGQLAWKIPLDTVRSLAEAVGHGQPQLKIRAAKVLEAIDEEKQDGFDRRWRAFSARYADELQALAAAAKKRKPAKPAFSKEALRQLVFGAYVGLGRQQGGAEEARIRETALSRLIASGVDDSVRAVLFLALGDPHQSVRKLAFDALKASGAQPTNLAAEALASGQKDIAALGFKVLLESGAGAAGNAILQRVLLTHDDGLELEAFKALGESGGQTSAAARALEARSKRLQSEALATLSRLYPEDRSAQEALRQALSSKFREVRLKAAVDLGLKRDSSAFEALIKLLETNETSEQRSILNALTTLGDPRTAGELLGRIERDPLKLSNQEPFLINLLKGVSQFRRPEEAPRLLALLKEGKVRRPAFGALFAISGFDQDPEDEEDDGSSSVESKQHPRRDEVLVQLFEALYRIGDLPPFTERLIPALRWARSGVVDAPLATLAGHPDADIRNGALEAIGWRLRKRNGPAAPLSKALAYPDPLAQFYAAEELAKAGRNEGIGILMSSAELLDSIDLRRRAIEALGKLADPRALDLLLRLANEQGHALQEQAAEALGHMGKTDKAETIFKRLAALAQGDARGLATSALRGLRWLGTREAWQLLREKARDSRSLLRAEIATLLGENSDPLTKELLAKLAIESDAWTAEKAMGSLRKLWGKESLEPDYVAMQSNFSDLVDLDEMLERLRKGGEPQRVFDLLHQIKPSVESNFRRPLILWLTKLQPRPIELAAKGLDSVFDRSAAVAARLLGYEGKAAAKKHGKPLVAATAKARQAWLDKRLQLQQSGDEAKKAQILKELSEATERYQAMLWACGRLETGAEELLLAAGLEVTHETSRQTRAVQASALLALARGFAGNAGLEALEKALGSEDASLRELAASALRSQAPAKAATFAERFLDDRPVLDRLLAGAQDPASASALREAVASLHRQGTALPHLLRSRDAQGLTTAVKNRELPEDTRLGALEALARLGSEEAAASILAVAREATETEELRKAAWKALRRARRSIAQATTRVNG